jgi:hypothetical protein
VGPPNAKLAAKLRDCLDLVRAVETGTWEGDTALKLSAVFREVVTIELSERFYRQASERLKARGTIRVLHGHSAQHLGPLAAQRVPTLYFLDAHWSTGATAGADEECPVLDEIRAIGPGHPNDCLVIDDARFFLSAPPAPLDPAKWPTITEIFDAIREQRPEHTVTVLADQVLAAPVRAKPILDEYGLLIAPRPPWHRRPLPARLLRVASIPHRRLERRRGVPHPRA